MAVGRVFWSSAILYVSLVLLHLHSPFFDVETFGEANELCGNASECTMNWRRDFFFCPSLATFRHVVRIIAAKAESSSQPGFLFILTQFSTFNLTRLTTSGDMSRNAHNNKNCKKEIMLANLANMAKMTILPQSPTRQSTKQ